MRKEKAREARRLNMLTAQGLSDSQAVNLPGMFPEWNPNGVSYGGEGETIIVRFEGELFRCINPHVSQADWDPKTAVSLWVSCADPAEEWPEWKQPAGAHDAYSEGAKVSYNGQRWISNVDGNVWKPGEYGWNIQE